MKCKQIVIYDANIIIDLYKIGLLPVIQNEDVTIHTTSLVMTELLNPKREEVKKLLPSLVIHAYDIPEQYATIIALQETLKKEQRIYNLSLTDISVLHLASELSAMLCTGDNALRKVALRKGVNVTGTIGVVLQLHNEQLINTTEAITALTHLNTTNPHIAPQLIENTILNLQK